MVKEKQLEKRMSWHNAVSYLECNKRYRFMTNEEVAKHTSTIVTWTDSDMEIAPELAWVTNGIDVYKSSKTVKLQVCLIEKEEYIQDLHNVREYIKINPETITSKFIRKYL